MNDCVEFLIMSTAKMALDKDQFNSVPNKFVSTNVSQAIAYTRLKLSPISNPAMRLLV
jgi:hypothetical protein